MSKIKLLLTLIDDVRTVADDLQQQAEMLPHHRQDLLGPRQDHHAAVAEALHSRPRRTCHSLHLQHAASTVTYSDIRPSQRSPYGGLMNIPECSQSTSSL